MFGKIINALVTPFNEQNQIDYKVLKKLLVLAENNNNSALVVGSTTGEGLSLTYQEKISLYRFCKENTELPCIYSISQPSLTRALEEIELLKELQIDGFLICSPYFVKPNQNGILMYYKELAKRLFPKPIILYNVPVRTNTNIEFNTIRKLIRTNKNIIGLKECSNDMSLIYLIKSNFPNFKVYIGDDKLFLDGLKNKADGVISVSSIIYGKEFKTIEEGFKEGYINQLLVEYMNLVHELLSIETNPVPIKTLLMLRGYKSMNLRIPLVNINEDKKNQIKILI